jgi:hypothetical protein
MFKLLLDGLKILHFTTKARLSSEKGSRIQNNAIGRV